METMKTFSKRLRSRREAMNLTQTALGEAIGVHRSSVWAYEEDKRSPTADVFMRMAQTLQVDPGWLMGLTDDIGHTVNVPVYQVPVPGEPLEIPSNQIGTEPVKSDDNINLCIIAKDQTMQSLRIMAGDLVCIKKNHPVVSGDVVLLNHPEQGVFIRRMIVEEKIKKVTLHAECNDVPDQVFDFDQWDDDWVIGKVAYSKLPKIV